MGAAVKTVTLIDLVFLLMLMLSGSLSGIASDAIYLLAFLVPFTIGFFYSKKLRREREEERGLSEPLDRFFTLKKDAALDFIPTVAPAVAVVFVMAALTAIVLNALGFSSSQPENRGFLEMLLIHALAPAILEEMLFRYIPMKLLLPYSPRWCVLISSLYFALIHANLFQLPYAFIAGVIFMTLDIAFSGIWPSLILHFVNNLLSVIWMKYCLTNGAMAVFFVSLLAITSISMIFIFIKRKKYASCVRKAFDNGVGYVGTVAPIALIVLSLYIAFMNLLV